ncbi:hypothetical protein IAT40_006117 [Kwoniella sp. CBS 6097]
MVSSGNSVHAAGQNAIRMAGDSRSAPSITQKTRSRGPSTRGSTRVDDEEAYIVAVVQGRGSGTEVGIAAHNLDTGRTTIIQLADTALFYKTIQHINRHPPCAILVPEASSNTPFSKHVQHHSNQTKLVKELESHFEMECELVSRDWWSSEDGTNFILEHSLNDEHKPSLLMSTADKYYALCAVGGLFKYLDAEQGVTYPLRSLKISYETLEGTMFIDTDTVKNLELVRNGLTNKSTGTLFSLLNGCVTPMGARLLRSCILQPSNVSATIEGRLDAVQELLMKPEKLKAIRGHLQSLGSVDLERLATRAWQKLEADASTYVTEKTVTGLLQIQKYLREALLLKFDLEDCQCLLLNQIKAEFADPDIKQIVNIIEGKSCPTSGNIMLTIQLCRNGTIARLYAVKSEYNPVLDVARQAYKENLADIETLAESLNSENEWCPRFPALPHIQLKSAILSSIRSTLCSTHELVGNESTLDRQQEMYGTHAPFQLKRNEKLQQSQQEVLLLSASIVADLLDRVIEHMNGLYLCADAIAKLDLVGNFARISSQEGHVRPEFTAALAIRAGRHPILYKMLGNECVPNDMLLPDMRLRGIPTSSLSTGRSEHISQLHAEYALITAWNLLSSMSGKSTFIRQIGLLTIQAMLGSFVPAEYASFPLHDYLLTRLSNDDLMEKNLSTFAVEMATTAMILSLATKRSLVLIDELGRGTAPLEGSGLACAIAEALIQRKAIVLFATHFQDLGRTLEASPGVQRLHLLVDSRHEGDNNEDAFLSTFQYKVSNGPINVRHYGLELAKLAALPASVIRRASEVSHKLADMEEEDCEANISRAHIKRRKIVLELVETLRYLAADSQTSNEVLAETLRATQRDYIAAFQATIKSTSDEAE